MKLDRFSIVELIVYLAVMVFFSIDMSPPIPAVVKVVINIIVIAGLIIMSVLMRKKRKDKQSVPLYMIVIMAASVVLGLVAGIILIINA
ncbi:MAG: hypothetical protein IKW87_06445 [Ruminococcus sp.]|nr:hypothetical protein [Ruminococcus sp.]